MIEYRTMVANDVSQVAQLEIESFSYPWSEKSISGELTNPLSLWIVAVAEDRVVGYIGSQSVLGEADMMNVAVSEEFRNQGIGRTLIETLVSMLREKQVYCITLEVRASNAPAIHLYESIGFTQVGRRPNYYSAPKEDALILKKEWECENPGN